LVAERIDDLLGEIDSNNGAWVPDQSIADALANVDKAVNDALIQGGYVEQATQYVRDLEGLPKANVDNMAKLTGLRVDEAILKTPMRAAIDRAAYAFGQNSVTQQLTEPIRQLLATNITGGASVPSTRAALNELIRGIDNDGGRFARYTNTLARDIVYSGDGAMAAEMIREYDLNAIRYIGSLVRDSRTQCVRWSKLPYILLKDLPAQVAWASGLSGYGSGKELTTTNFATVRGGWNCRHIVVPIRVDL
jgi:hypothetical protein